MAFYQRLEAAAAELGLSFEAPAEAVGALNQAVSAHTAEDGEILHKQHGMAQRLCFLEAGTAHFCRTRRQEKTEMAATSLPLVPLGLSGLNSPGRYMTEVSLEAGSRYHCLPHEKWWRILYTYPPFAAQLMAFLLARGSHLLWATRGLEDVYRAEGAAPVAGVLSTGEDDSLQRMGEGAFFAPLGEERLADLLTHAEFRLFSKGETITVEGQNSDGIYVLYYGRVEASFHTAREGRLTRQARTVARPGVALSWSDGLTDVAAPYTVTATRDSTMLRIPKDKIAMLAADDPMLAVALIQRQLWQLGRYQQTASGLAAYAAENEADLLEALLEDNAARIPVQSELHGAAHALRNRFTRGYALECIYRTVIDGNDAERSIAGLVMDALSGMEREHRFFEQLNTVYARVAGASRDTNPAMIRQLSNADFIRAYDQVPHVIKGMENLPDTATNIFFYNHIASSKDTALANGHIFAIDSHFVSTKILLNRYGDAGKRIVRVGKETEFSHHAYYSRLDNIYVHTPESEMLQETPDEKVWRKELLFVEAQKVFDAGRPLAIAPEGTAGTDDNLTANSPGPFKPGAFLLAGRLQPEPMLVPIALANFDRPVARATYAAVIKPPFRIRDRVKDIEDREEMARFLADYREEFRTYVAEARALAEAVYEDEAARKGLMTNVGLVSPVEEEFESDIRALELRVLEQARRSGKTVLFGSSTFRLWKSAKQDLSDPHLMNLGFGGATLTACRSFFDRVVVPHNPDTLLFYAGDNDVGAGASAEQVAHEFSLLVAQVAERLPKARCFVVSIKPSPFRAQFLPVILAANKLIREIAEGHGQWRFIDFTSPMLDDAGTPSGMFYDSDPLHVNIAGYGLLAKLIRDALARE